MKWSKASTRPRSGPDRYRTVKLPAFYLIVLLATIFFIGPYALVFLGALKTQQQIATDLPWSLPEHPSFANFVDILVQAGFSQSLWITFSSSIVLATGQVCCSLMGAYAFARLRFRGRDLLFGTYLATMMIPNVVTMIPLFIIMNRLQLLNTFWALVLPYVFGTPYAVFLMRQFLLTVPEEVIQAAKLDGCGEFQALIRVVVPMARPIIIVAAVIAFVFGWNNFLWPLIATNSPELQVLTVGLANFQANANVAPRWNLLFAGATLTLVPVVIIFSVFHRWIVGSIQLGGVNR